MPKPTDLSGLKLSGKYELIKQLGYGGFGAAYLANSLQIENEQVVIKVLHEELAADTKFAARFRREAIAARRIKHPHVVTVYDYDHEPTRPLAPAYIVMELVAGESLHDYLRRAGRLDINHAATLFTHICATVGAMHAQNIWHRDLKPQNIMVLPPADKPEKAVVLDFGLAKIADGEMTELTETGIAFGSYYYMPPEQWRDVKSVDARADVYSLAIILYQMLAGKRPFEGPVQTLALLHYSDPPPPFDKSLNIPSALVDVVNQALEKSPDKRPKDAAELGRLVSEAMSGGGLQSFAFETVTVNERGDISQRTVKQARYFVEDIKGVALEMVETPGGSFLMGSTEAQAKAAWEEAKRYYKDAPWEWFKSELPQRRVAVPPFFMGKGAVTQGQWRAVAKLPQAQIELQPEPSHFKGDDLRPVEQVNWHEAQEFCVRLSNLTGRAYRLPSEAEWEYACRAGTETPFAFGATITPDLVNYDGNYPYGQAAKGEYRAKTFPGFSGKPNGFGLYNMHGNIWEWCEDIWQPDYEGLAADGSANISAGDSSFRVLRGGSWGDGAWDCRSANRNRIDPRNRDINNGFRVALAFSK